MVSGVVRNRGHKCSWFWEDSDSDSHGKGHDGSDDDEEISDFFCDNDNPWFNNLVLTSAAKM